MDKKTRVLAALLGGRVDRVPVTGIVTSVTQSMMEEYDAYWPDAHRDPELMARLGAAAHTLYGFETVKVPFDVVVEAEALGAEVRYGDVDVFPQSTPLYDDPSEMEVPNDFLLRGRVPVVLEAIKLLRERYGTEVAVVSHLMGPFSLSGILFGVSELLLWMVTEPDKCRHAMEQATDLAIRYARAHIVAGSDVIQFGESTASGDMISPAQYGEHVMPHHCKLIEAVACPTVLNITGDITDRLDIIAGTGASAICMEDCVDLRVARQTVGNRMALVGNVPIVTLSEGTPDIISALAREAIRGGVDLLNPAGTLLTDTPENNLEAMVAIATGA